MKTIQNTRNYTRNPDGLVSCIFNHPDLGEIPNGLDPILDAELIAEAEAAGLISEPEQAEKDAHMQSELIRHATVKVQGMLDKEARERGYDDVNAIGKYIGYDNPFRTECEALGSWCAACWAKCYELQSGGVMPDDLLAEMPKMVL